MAHLLVKQRRSDAALYNGHGEAGQGKGFHIVFELMRKSNLSMPCNHVILHHLVFRCLWFFDFVFNYYTIGEISQNKHRFII